MTESEKLLELEIPENFKLIQVYDNGRYSTIVAGDRVFLLFTTKVSKYNIIATFDKYENWVIYNRDRANMFVDWSHEAFNKEHPVQLDKLSDAQLAEYLVSYLASDIKYLLKFELTDEILNLVKEFPENFQKTINKGLDELCLSGNHGIPFTRVYTQNQVNWFFNRKFYYICMNLETKKFEVTNGTFTKVFKNGSAGTWKQLLSNPKCYIFFFNRTDDTTLYGEDLDRQVNFDLQKSPYEVANSFLKLESKFAKAMDNTVSFITGKTGAIPADMVYYSDIEQSVESVSNDIRLWQKSKDLDIKAKCFSDIKNTYECIYGELQHMQDALRKLTNYAEGIK